MQHVRKTRRTTRAKALPKEQKASAPPSVLTQRPRNVVGALLHHFRKWKPEALEGAECQQLIKDASST